MTNEVVQSFKGFDAYWKCLDFQYAIGQQYTHAGKVQACEGGFHACEYPLDVFSYYPPAGSKFAQVEQSGQLSRHTSDSKIASSTLRVVAELSLAGIVKAAIDYTFKRSKPEGESATGDQGAASATGYQGAASATGNRGAASATGDQGAASATGYRGAASATGADACAAATGYRGMAKGAAGCALFLVFRDDDYRIVHAWAGIVGRDGIEPDQFYTLDANGKPQQVKSE